MINRIIVIVLSFLLLQCKKEKSTEPSPTTQGSGSGIVEPTNLYGTMDLTKIWSISRSNILQSSNSIHAWAVFTGAPFADEMDDYPAGIDVGDVLINGDPLEESGISSGDVEYDNYTQSGGPIVAPFSWVIEGAGSVPGFNYTPQSSFPSFTNVHIFPDTVHTSQDLTINLGSISGYTDIYGEIGGFYAGKMNIASSGPYNNSFTISSADLQSNPPTQWQQKIRLWFHKKSYTVAGGKTYKFQNILYFERDSVVFVP